MTLRQRHTEGAILYEKKLKPFLKSLNEGKGTRCPHLAMRCQPVGCPRLFWGGELQSLTLRFTGVAMRSVSRPRWGHQGKKGLTQVASGFLLRPQASLGL